VGAALRRDRAHEVVVRAYEFNDFDLSGYRGVQTKAREPKLAGLKNNAGSDLLSHTVSHAVPSAVSGLTSVFGMGTGVTLIL
jgi:hypothetical protein